MSLQQVRFLGSSITSFSANLGWGNENSHLQVGLVDDVVNGDDFNPPDVGSPIYFNYGGWEFNGLLEHTEISRSFSGNPIYNISIVDPRSLLDGYQIILSDYFGPINGIPNIGNIFGYLENTGGFGSSGKNESGIEWWRIVFALEALTAFEGPSTYGGPISYKGFTYNVDLSNLPFLASFYRVSASPNMSLMDFINEICEAGACEYFVTLEGSTIVINTISRFNIPLKGQINQYVNTTQGAVSTDSGLDMVNETTSKFLIGGSKTDVFFNFYDKTATIKPIWYYWGNDSDGNLIINNSYQSFNLDARNVLVQGVPDSYPTDMSEMRAALQSQESWESFLWFECFNQFIFDINGTLTDTLYQIVSNGNFIPGGTKYKHSGIINPHFKKAYYIGLGSNNIQNIMAYLLGNSPASIVAANSRALMGLQNINNFNQRSEPDEVDKVYELIHSFADEYYGRKFMVTVPNVFVATDSETGELLFSHNVTDAGYLEEDVLEQAVQSNLSPPFLNEITTPDNRVMAYVRFDNISQLDLSGIEPKDLLFSTTLIKSADGTRYDGSSITSVFIRCTVDDDYVFLDNVNFTSPRVVITLTSRVYQINTDNLSEKILLDYINIAGGMSNWTNQQKEDIFNKLTSSIRGDAWNIFSFPLVAIPAMAAIPLKSNTETYGPWLSIGANGKVEVEQSEDLVPWNYSGYTNMNLTANARVSLSSANLQWIESGTIEFPGVPDHNLGAQLLGSGPYVTDISIKIGIDGVTTTYKMRSWNPRFGKVGKAYIDKMNKTNKVSQQIRRNMQEEIKLNTFKNKYLEFRSLTRPRSI